MEKVHPFTELLWFLSFLLLSPLIIGQAIYTRKTALRLPEAGGPQSGRIEKNSDKIIHFAMMGESTVAGVGVENQSQGLVANTALALSEEWDCTVCWYAYGKNGVDVQGTLDFLLPRTASQEIDYLVVSLGVNDTTGMTSLSKWRDSISELIEAIQAKHSCHIFFTSVPPMEKFTALPQPLRFVLGLRAALLQNILNQHPLNQKQFQLIPAKPLDSPEYLAIDGYHPSESGYQLWGKDIAQFIKNSRVMTIPSPK